jgi:hypothetical protein
MSLVNSKSPLTISSVAGEVPSKPISSTEAHVANGVSHDCLKCLSFCSRIDLVIFLWLLSLVHSFTLLNGGTFWCW